MKTPAVFLSAFFVASAIVGQTAAAQSQPHVWEKVELTLHATNQYTNPYTQVVVWVDLKGPGFDKRCYGFWDGSNVFRVRVLATAPGNWLWRGGSEPADPGLAGKTPTAAA
jgi:hypothetical protein